MLYLILLRTKCNSDFFFHSFLHKNFYHMFFYKLAHCPILLTPISTWFLSILTTSMPYRILKFVATVNINVRNWILSKILSNVVIPKSSHRPLSHRLTKHDNNIRLSPIWATWPSDLSHRGIIKYCRVNTIVNTINLNVALTTSSTSSTSTSTPIGFN